MAQVEVREESGEGVALMERWKGYRSVVLVDAVSSGGKPGTIHRFDAHLRSIPAKFFHSSTHSFGLAEAVELARAIGELPPRLVVYGIEAKRFEAGLGLAEEIGIAAAAVVEDIVAEARLAAAGAPGG
jgi:hydrogenase maturation protease